MAHANEELREATEGLRAVLDQCSRLGHATADSDAPAGPTLPVAAAAAIVQAGLREAGERVTTIETATAAAEERRRLWQVANQRHEAVDRLVDRWREEERVETGKRNDEHLDDVITARGHRTGRAEGPQR